MASFVICSHKYIVRMVKSLRMRLAGHTADGREEKSTVLLLEFDVL
jgi:hypothetical protein